MTTEMTDLLRSALLNNSYDYKSMHMALRKTWETSFSYLYQLQRSYIEYEEHQHISNDEESRKESEIGHLYLNDFLACFDIASDFIHIRDREEYYHSEYYRKEFTIEDMVNHPEIFSKIPIIIIDDQVLWDYTIQLRNNHFTVTLPFGRSFVIDRERKADGDLVYLERKIQVMVVDNVFYKRLTVNKSDISVSSNNVITFDSSNYNMTNGLYFASIHFFNDNKYGEGYELGSGLIHLRKNNNLFIGEVNQTISDKISSSGDFYISIIFINNLKEHQFYTGNKYTECDENGFCNVAIPKNIDNKFYAMPIPRENFIVIKKSKSAGEFKLMKNTDSLCLYYPNIYKIVDSEMETGDKYYLYYFYKDATTLKYTNMYDFFNKYLSVKWDNKSYEEIYSRLLNGTLSDMTFTDEQQTEFEQHLEKVLKEMTMIYNYGDVDFVKRYLPENPDDVEVQYKINTMDNFVSDDYNALRDYVIEQNKVYEPVYHCWATNINLNKRVRTNPINETGTDHEFSEERYVFSFRDENMTDNKTLDVRIYVDGFYMSDVYHERYLHTDYLYIPTEAIEQDSYIEMEVFPAYEHVTALSFDNINDEVDISLIEPADRIFPTAADWYIMNPSNPITKRKTQSDDAFGGNTTFEEYDVSLKFGEGVEEHPERLDRGVVQLTTKFKDVNFKLEENVSDRTTGEFARLLNFKVKALTEDVIGKTIWFRIAKIPHFLPYKVEKSGYPFIEIQQKNFNFNLEYLRIFRNGRLVPKEKYVFKYSHYYPRIYFYDDCEEGDVLYIDIAPYRYREIYYQKDLDNVKYPVVNLKDVLDKPFDIRYYDVYINGRKVSLNNIFSISPWQITFTNLYSYHNLQIFEKDRDFEFFGKTYDESKRSNYWYTLEDLFDSEYINDNEKNKIIEKIINEKKEPELDLKPNVDIEDIQDHTDLRTSPALVSYIFYYNELLPKTYVNPVRLQFNEEFIMDDYPLIGEEYMTDPNKEGQPKILYLNPNRCIAGKDNITNTQWVYCIGHPTKSVFKDKTLDSTIEQPVILFEPNINI